MRFKPDNIVVRILSEYSHLISALPAVLLAHFAVGNVWITLWVLFLTLLINMSLMVTKHCLLIRLGEHRYVGWMFPKISYGPDWIDLITFGFSKGEIATFYTLGIWCEHFLPFHIKKLTFLKRMTMIFMWNIYFKRTIQPIRLGKE